MSPSSAASKRSFASSSRRLARLAVAALRALAESRGLVALQRALRVSFGAFAAAIVAFTWLGTEATVLLRIAGAIVPALGAMSMMLVVALGLELARTFKLDPFPLIAGAIASFALALPHSAIDGGTLAFFRALGGSGILLAIAIGFAIAGGAEALRRTSLGPRAPIWVAALAVAAFFAVLAAAGVSVASLVYDALVPLGGLGDSFAALLTIVVVETLLWTLGIHGPALLAAILTPVYLTLQSQNGEAFAHGNPLPHIVTISTFLFVFPGGAGATLPLVLMMLRSRLRPLRVLAAATVMPSICGVNEPLLFGLPMVMEPLLAFPFVAVPVVLSATTYGAIAGGIVARPAYYVPAVVPPVLNAFLATADWRACILALVNLAIAGAMYVPFLRLYERSREARLQGRVA